MNGWTDGWMDGWMDGRCWNRNLRLRGTPWKHGIVCIFFVENIQNKRLRRIIL